MPRSPPGHRAAACTPGALGRHGLPAAPELGLGPLVGLGRAHRPPRDRRSGAAAPRAWRLRDDLARDRAARPGLPPGQRAAPACRRDRSSLQVAIAQHEDARSSSPSRDTRRSPARRPRHRLHAPATASGRADRRPAAASSAPTASTMVGKRSTWLAICGTAPACRDARPRHDQRHADRALVQAALAEKPVLAGEIAVVAGVEDPRVAGIRPMPRALAAPRRSARRDARSARDSPPAMRRICALVGERARAHDVAKMLVGRMLAALSGR